MKKKTARKPKARKKLALGKGLDALIPDIEPAESRASDYFECDINLITPNRFQPRTRFPKGELEELSSSIREQGIIQPLVVRKNKDGYELVTGERRLRASKIAGLERVPVIVRDISDKEMLELSIVENIQREDLNPIEEAEAYQRLISEFNLTQEQISKRVGKSRPAVANFLRLLQLPGQIKDSIMDNMLSMGHARALLGADTPARQKAAWRKVLSTGLSVRETEVLIQQLQSKKKKKPGKPPSGSDAIYFSSLEDDLSRKLGTRVRIKRRGKKGRLEIEFYSDDDLDRLIHLFK